jgi:hypothetical protein
MICTSYDSAAMLAGFALAVELLRESDMSADELAQLLEFENAAIKGILRCPDGTLMGDVMFWDDPRGYWMSIHRKTQETTPSNMQGRLRLPERQLVELLRKCKQSGSPTWHQDYLRECETLAEALIPARIQRWNTRHPRHQVQWPPKPKRQKGSGLLGLFDAFLPAPNDAPLSPPVDENRERITRETQSAKAAVIDRAVSRGIAAPETVLQVIYDMPVSDFLKLTADFPNLSRVDFKPPGLGYAKKPDEKTKIDENMARALEETAAAKSTIIERALAAGIGTPETISRIIYDMSVPDFRELTAGFPKLSRVDFKPLQP